MGYHFCVGYYFLKYGVLALICGSCRARRCVHRCWSWSVAVVRVEGQWSTWCRPERSKALHPWRSPRPLPRRYIGCRQNGDRIRRRTKWKPSRPVDCHSGWTRPFCCYFACLAPSLTLSSAATKRPFSKRSSSRSISSPTWPWAKCQQISTPYSPLSTLSFSSLLDWPSCPCVPTSRLQVYSRTRISAQNAYQLLEHTPPRKEATQFSVVSFHVGVCSNNWYAFVHLSGFDCIKKTRRPDRGVVYWALQHINQHAMFCVVRSSPHISFALDTVVFCPVWSPSVRLYSRRAENQSGPTIVLCLCCLIGPENN